MDRHRGYNLLLPITTLDTFVQSPERRFIGNNGINPFHRTSRRPGAKSIITIVNMSPFGLHGVFHTMLKYCVVIGCLTRTLSPKGLSTGPLKSNRESCATSSDIKVLRVEGSR